MHSAPFYLIAIPLLAFGYPMSSSLHLRPPFRAEHVGSLIRTRALYEKRRDLESGKCTKEDLKPLEDEAIKHVVKLQRDLGIRTITDGEMRRSVSTTLPIQSSDQYLFSLGSYSLKVYSKNWKA